MIVENPYTQPHYLTLYFPVQPTLIDKDRSANGDYYKKPTQYWFVNCEPEQNVMFEAMNQVNRLTIDGMNQVNRLTIDGMNQVNRQVLRSMIHPQYARRFIIQHIIDCDGGLYT